jgi:hypothetical protein
LDSLDVSSDDEADLGEASDMEQVPVIVRLNPADTTHQFARELGLDTHSIHSMSDSFFGNVRESGRRSVGLRLSAFEPDMRDDVEEQSMMEEEEEPGAPSILGDLSRLTATPTSASTQIPHGHGILPPPKIVTLPSPITPEHSIFASYPAPASIGVVHIASGVPLPLDDGTQQYNRELRSPTARRDMDPLIMFGQSFRVGWGTGLTMVHCGIEVVQAEEAESKLTENQV